MFELRYIVLAEDAFCLEDLEHFPIFTTRVRRVQTGQIAINRPPENNVPAYIILTANYIEKTARRLPKYV